MDVVPIADKPLGAELVDVDLSKPLEDADIAKVRQAFADYSLLIIRGQNLQGEDQDRFIEYLGPLQQFDNGAYHQFMTTEPVENASGDTNKRLLFHNDGAYRDVPRAGTSLYALDVAPTSAPTLFANGVRAYEKLPQELKDKIANLHAVNILDLSLGGDESQRSRVADFPEGKTLDDVRWYEHPLVLTLPHSGKKTLFVSEFYTSHIAEFGPDSEEGEALLQELYGYLYSDDNTSSHHYTNGDLVVWDNYAAQHARADAVDNKTRHLRRLVLKELAYTKEDLATPVA